MWTRKELKEKGKVSFKANYWKAVGIALVLTAVMTGVGSSFPSGTVSIPPTTATVTSVTDGDGMRAYSDDGDISIDSEAGSLRIHEDDDTLTIDTGTGTLVVDGDDGTVELKRNDASSGESGSAGISISASDADEGAVSVYLDENDFPWQVLPGLLAGLFTFSLIVIAFGLTIWAFIFNPLQAGCRGFFTANLNRKAEVREVASPFDHGYVNVVKAMILRDVFTFLWTLLFIIPGIVKSYEYRLIPYLVADHPEMGYKEAFAESKRLMHGNKWNTFVLDLSFIGWWILSGLTLGLLAVFYVSPYHAATSAALYEKLAYESQLPPFANQPVSVNPVPSISADTVDAYEDGTHIGAHAR